MILTTTWRHRWPRYVGLVPAEINMWGIINVACYINRDINIVVWYMHLHCDFTCRLSRSCTLSINLFTCVLSWEIIHPLSKKEHTNIQRVYLCYYICIDGPVPHQWCLWRERCQDHHARWVAKGFHALGVTGAGSDMCSRILSVAFRESGCITYCRYTTRTDADNVCWIYGICVWFTGNSMGIDG